ncbi:kinase-like domain-containing protein [Chiua virens]|nr:kinase-like domain-containing protein [Chiua virens]KAG9310251.1 kinase-like domain-containing protein [Chiua virens]
MGANHSQPKDRKEERNEKPKRSPTLLGKASSRLNLLGLGRRSPQPPATPVTPSTPHAVTVVDFAEQGTTSPEPSAMDPEDRPELAVEDQESDPVITMPQQPVTVPCQYRTGRTLGSGTYAIVKEAIHIKTGQYYACKVINKKLMEGREHMVRNEIAVLKRVSIGHLNIVTLHDYFETSHNLYLCFDLCTGGELFDSICARGQYTEADAAGLIRTIFGAVKYIHDCDIVHRDLKPENLLFRSKPEKTSEIMIADFGLSRVMPDSKLSMLTEVCGTPGYMAPEIFKKTGHGKPVDIWAMGVITYFLLAGYTPFDRDTQRQEMEAIIAGDYRFEPEEYWSNVSEAARNFVSTCLTVDPDARPTAEQMLQHSWLTAEIPHFVEGENGQPADLLPHVRKAFNARRTFRKAVFSMMAMKRMSMLAHDHHLSPEHRQLNEDVYQFKQESEKESLEHADVLHHHNADQDSAAVFEGTNREEVVSVAQGRDGVVPAESAKQSKEVTEKLAAVSLTASAKKVFNRFARGGK